MPKHTDISKILVAVTAAWVLLLFDSAIAAETCVVTSLEEQRSSTHINFVIDDRGAGRVTVDIYKHEPGISYTEENGSKPTLEVVSDSRAVFQTVRLQRGHYHAVAHATYGGRADLYLNVVPKSEENSSIFTLRLCNMPPSRQAEWKPSDEDIPVKVRIPVFRGGLCDPTGAAIPGAEIKVVRKGSEGKDVVANLKCESDGRFALKLPDGLYIAFFFSPGFEIRVVPFEITSGSLGELRVVLPIGSTT